MPILRFVVYGIAKTLSKVFGLATMAFFGRMPSRDDDKLAAVGLVAVSWVPVVVAIFWPALAEVIIPFAPDDETVLRWIAIGLTMTMPLVAGLLVARVHNRQDGDGPSRVAALLHGYWYTPVIGLTVVAVVIAVPLIKAGHIAKRFEVQRLLVMIPAGSYEQVVDHAAETLRRRGLTADVKDASWPLARMFNLLGFVLGHIFGREVATEMKVIRGRDADDEPYEVTIHAADVTILGKQKQSSRVFAVLAEELDEREVFFTWDDDSQEVERRLSEQRQILEDGGEPDLEVVRQLAEDLAQLELDTEEWNNVRRLLFRLERDTYARHADLPDPEPEVQEVQERDPEEAGSVVHADGPPPRVADDLGRVSAR
jgi:hypothetical protein